MEAGSEGAQVSQVFFWGSLLIDQEWFGLVVENSVESRLSTNLINYLQNESEEGPSRRNSWTCKGEIRKDWLDAVKGLVRYQVQHEHYLKLHQAKNDHRKC